MSEQEGTQSTTKQRRSRKINTVNQENGKQVSAAQRPTNDDKETWKEYWAKVQPIEWFKAWGYWRTKKEIDSERQKFLTEHRNITPNIEKGVYPFRNIEPELTRADIEWLLATHENGRGPVDWNDENQHERQGLDLRGADLRGIDLSSLPLARLQGGLNLDSTEEQCIMAATHLEGAVLRRANLHQAILNKTYLQGAELSWAHLDAANLTQAHLEDARLFEAQLEGACLYVAHLKGAVLNKAHLEKADLRVANLENANLYGAHLKGANLLSAHLEKADLREAHLTEANLENVHLEGANLYRANLAGARCNRTFFDSATRLNNVTFSDLKHGCATLADISWGGVNLSVIDWTKIRYIAEERESRRFKVLQKYLTAARTNRQLAIALEDQGLDERAAIFAYRARRMQQQALPLQAILRLKQKQRYRWLLRLIRLRGRKFHLRLLAYLLPTIFYLLLVIFTFTSLQLDSLEIIVALVFAELIFLPIILFIFFILPITRLILLILSLLLIPTLSVLLFFHFLFVWLLLPLFLVKHITSPIEFILSATPILISTILIYLIVFLAFRWFKRLKRQVQRFLLMFKSLSLLLVDTLNDFGQYIYSKFLDSVSGHGYKPWRSFRTYLLVILTFAIAYYVIGIKVGPAMSPLGSFVFSMTSFHGRGFFPGGISLDDPLTVLAALEAFVGLLIEVTFIATLTQRLFRK